VYHREKEKAREKEKEKEKERMLSVITVFQKRTKTRRGEKATKREQRDR
jgi:hypothetical protein